jgi:hypothetical protein
MPAAIAGDPDVSRKSWAAASWNFGSALMELASSRESLFQSAKL